MTAIIVLGSMAVILTIWMLYYDHRHCCIYVKEHNGQIVDVELKYALGPFPLRNYTWTGIHFNNLDRAKEAAARIETVSLKWRYDAFMLAMFGKEVTEQAAREEFYRRTRCESKKIEYRI